MSDKKGLKREDTLTDEDDNAQNIRENKSITGILKGGGIDHSNRATVMMICEDSGIQFDTRCLRLTENDEAKIGRCIKAGGTLPDKVQMSLSNESFISFDFIFINLSYNQNNIKIYLNSQTNGIFECKVLSRQHASIFYKDGSFFLRDLKSSNGTYHNNM